MAPQRYERVPENEPLQPSPSSSLGPQSVVPLSPPPSFRSRASSSASHHRHAQSQSNAVDRTLVDTFGDGDASDSDPEDADSRQRLMRDNVSATQSERESVSTQGSLSRRFTEIPTFTPLSTTNLHVISGSRVTASNDGVFANLDAKPERGEKLEEQPPSYEQAAADATPPYWETTITAPGMMSDEVYVDGLPVGSLFSFVWNGVISMSFQLVGFLLTYLLHTTHAAKNGSRAGLGINLIHYGFYMKSSTSRNSGSVDTPVGSDTNVPMDPNAHDFDPHAVADSTASVMAAAMAAAQIEQKDGNGDPAQSGFPAAEWMAYVLMIVGWFILIRAVTDFIKARRHEQLVLRSPDRGLSVPVVAEGEGTETVV
ncbi:hypothetical protein MMC25_007967 [Agyrium rufum]|nr:hypothetical protein [Agyrium rufum]